MQFLKYLLSRLMHGQPTGELEERSPETSSDDAHVDTEPRLPLHEQQQERNLPATVQTPLAELENAALLHPMVDDPSLGNARRTGVPGFTSKDNETLRHSILNHVLHHILSVIQSVRDADRLVLRGSILLASWFGNFGRRPGDLDWVMLNRRWGIGRETPLAMIESISQALRGTQIEGPVNVLIPDRPFAVETIWAYDRAPGKRVIIPWTAENSLFNGSVQMDFVVGEPIPDPPIQTQVKLGELPPVTLQTATQEQSLAWKLLWLASDEYALGKDLYDAVLLAEEFPLQLEVLRKTFDAAPAEQWDLFRNFTRDSIFDWYIEWEEFQHHYPHIEGTAEEWKCRLVAALSPLWKQLDKTGRMS